MAGCFAGAVMPCDQSLGTSPWLYFRSRLLNSYLLVVVVGLAVIPLTLRASVSPWKHKGHKTDLEGCKGRKSKMMVARVGGREFPNLQGSVAVS